MNVYLKLRNFLFFDIETVREFNTYEEFLASGRSGKIWEKIAAKIIKDENLTPAQAYVSKAGLYAEYAKVLTVCFGYYQIVDGKVEKKIVGVCSENETEVLERSISVFNGMYERNPETILAGHNIKEFDIQFLIKRMIKNNLKMAEIFKVYLSCKPWETPATDTLYDWRMSGPRFMGLDAIADFLGLESSKTGAVEGSMLGEFYWNDPRPMEEKLGEITTYCKADIRVNMEMAERLAKALPRPA